MEENMIRKWAEVNRLARRSSNYQIAKDHNLLWLLGLLFVLYFVSSGGALYLSTKGGVLIPLLIIGTTMGFMQLVLNSAILKNYKEELEGIGYAQKLIYFRYILFRDAFQNHSILKLNQIDSLLSWQVIESQKNDSTSFFKSKLFINPATGVLSLVLAWFGIKESTSLELTMILVVMVGLLFLAWSIHDLFMIGTKRQLELKRYLEWLRLETNSKQK